MQLRKPNGQGAKNPSAEYAGLPAILYASYGEYVAESGYPRGGFGRDCHRYRDSPETPTLENPKMPDYQRYRVSGGTYFFTVNLLERHPNDLLVR